MIGWKDKIDASKVTQVGRDSSIYVGKRLRVATLRDAKIEIRYPKRFEDGPQTNKLRPPFPLSTPFQFSPYFVPSGGGPLRVSLRGWKDARSKNTRLDTGATLFFPRGWIDPARITPRVTVFRRLGLARGYQTTNSFSPRFEIQLINSSLINPPFEFLPRVE